MEPGEPARITRLVLEDRSVEAPFLQAIADCPNDGASRLVYADWLEERSDRRAGFLRAECALAATEPEARSRWLHLLADLLAAGRGCDRRWMSQVSRVPIPPIHCRLELTPDPRRPRAPYPDASVELVNATDELVFIELRGRGQSLFRFLDLIYRDVRGELVPAYYYGHAFMNFMHHAKYEFLPAQPRRGTVALMSNIKRPPKKPEPKDWGLPAGLYTAQAIFNYDGWTAASELVPFEFRP
jgi:uncharacterized protein (TIGR02996 family)